MTKKRIVVGMSGGVDSSVAAKLLLDADYEVIGLFMHNWEETENGVCTSAEDWADVQAVCGKLNIAHYSVNFAADYTERVFKYFLEEYAAGRTPNPDVLCNREIKFGPFKDYALKLGADYIATGHYCDVAHFENDLFKQQNEITDAEKMMFCLNSHLIKAADENKDQTYFLNQISTAQLSRVLFPLGKLIKPQVRKIAEENGLVTAKKKDSTGICFIGERKFKQFLMEYLPAKSGKIRDINGKILGEHSGLMYYTLGQRKGLGIGGVRDEQQSRWYVVDKELKTNTLILSCGEGEELLSDYCTTGKINVIGDFDFPRELKCNAKFRYRQPEQGVTVVKKDNGNLKIIFDKPQRAVTPGQYAVLYLGSRCLGGAVIESYGKQS